MTATHRPLRLVALPLAALALAASGCSTELAWSPFAPGAATVAQSPEAAVRAVARSWSTLDASLYRRTLTERFRFGCAALDSSGNPYPDDPWTVEDELAFFQHLTQGGTLGQPRMRRIAMTLSPSLVSFPDPRDVDPRTRRVIRSAIELEMRDVLGAEYRMSAKALFFLVRGDSAAIPQDVRASLGAPDSAVWFVDGWDDETFVTGGVTPARVLPTEPLTLCELRLRYR